MGGAVSYAAAAMGGGSSAAKDVDAVDWLNLPCPVKYEEIQRENISKWNFNPPFFDGIARSARKYAHFMLAGV